MRRVKSKILILMIYLLECEICPDNRRDFLDNYKMRNKKAGNINQQNSSAIVDVYFKTKMREY